MISYLDLTTPIDRDAFTIVTVIFEKELNFLKLQARSLEKYVDHSCIREILVVGNWVDENFSEEKFWAAIGNSYGRLRSRVRFMKASQVATFKSKDGWRTQQVLKLKISRFISTAGYVILDAKNHFIRPLGYKDFFSETGLPKAFFNDFSEHTMRVHFEATFEYIGVPVSPHIKFALPTTTPFPAETKLVRDMIEYLEMRDKQSFSSTFTASGCRYTEFFLLNAFILKSRGDLRTSYAFGQSMSVTIFKNSAEPSAVERMIGYAAAEERIKTFAVHRITSELIGPEEKMKISAFWHSRGLVETAEAGLELFERDS